MICKSNIGANKGGSMKIALPAGTPDMTARVENKLGTAPYLLVIDTDDMTFEAIEGPPLTAGPGSGIQAVTLVLGMGAKTLLVGTISPGIARTLRKSGIEIITGVDGTVKDAVERYRRGDFSRPDTAGQKAEAETVSSRMPLLQDAFKRTIRQFAGMLPTLSGVILLVGLFQGFVPGNLLLSLFPGNAIQDTLLGTVAGSMLAGSPINSYVLGQTLLEIGVSLFGVTALMLSWVNIGLVQLPAEIAALGSRFAVRRNLAAFIMVMFVSMLIVFLTRFSL